MESRSAILRRTPRMIRPFRSSSKRYLTLVTRVWEIGGWLIGAGGVYSRNLYAVRSAPARVLPRRHAPFEGRHLSFPGASDNRRWPHKPEQVREPGIPGRFLPELRFPEGMNDTVQ